MGLVNQNLSAFRDLQRRLDAVAAGKHREELAKRVAVGFHKKVQDQFRDSHDPYGKAWKSVVRMRARDVRARARRAAAGRPIRADKPLVDTGRLRASAHARVVGTSVRIALPVEYASYHQYGTSRIARRQILPEADSGGLPPTWNLLVSKETVAVLKKQMGVK